MFFLESRVGIEAGANAKTKELYMSEEELQIVSKVVKSEEGASCSYMHVMFAFITDLTPYRVERTAYS